MAITSGYEWSFNVRSLKCKRGFEKVSCNINGRLTKEWKKQQYMLRNQKQKTQVVIVLSIKDRTICMEVLNDEI